jgi:hypothetical protein
MSKMDFTDSHIKDLLTDEQNDRTPGNEKVKTYSTHQLMQGLWALAKKVTALEEEIENLKRK